ncbi:MAG: DUF3014 domain-containing protein, partial [Xanthomonadales bacterium]|nr:DUF3014 domain-containing protein [Xanthomonadales bacterium]
MGTWITIIIVILILIPVGWWWGVHHATPTASLAQIAPATASTAAAAPSYPIDQAHTTLPAVSSSASLPPLDNSDNGVRQSLNHLLGDSPLQHLLARSDVIARIVATIDALPHKKLGRNILPIQPPKGVFATTQQAGKLVVGNSNASRYQPYMDWIDSVPTDTLVAWYVRHYPQFQQAYRQLGYPTGYFNDRLIAVIDHLLATPTPSKPIVLTQPH